MPAKKNLESPNLKEGVKKRYKQKVWQTVDKPRGNIDAAHSSNVFQQFISRPHLFF
jgi:hypothetical protein